MRSLLRSFRLTEYGQGVIEYALALAAVVVIAAVLANNDVDDKVNSTFANTTETFEEIEN